MDEANDALPEDADSMASVADSDTGTTEEQSEREPSPDVFNQSRQDDALNNPTVNMQIDLARIHQGMFSPVILLNNVNSVPEVQATVEIRMEDPNEISPDDDDDGEEGIQPIPLGSVPAPEEAQQRLSVDRAVDESVVVVSDTSPNQSDQISTPHRKKRKRTITPKRSIYSPATRKEEDDEGLLCSICLDEWTLTGEHRVVSLKCGHLFGMSCIKRWMQDKTAANRSCATCKARATMRDIRFIYARCVKAVDNTREEELQQELDGEKKKVFELNIKLSITSAELAQQRILAERYKSKLDAINAGAFIDTAMPGVSERRHTYKLFLEKNIEISREPGCRALAYAAKHQTLLVSQKSTQPLFPGFSVRMLQVPEFSVSSGAASMLVSAKTVRDIAVDASDDLFACATMEKMVKVFSIQNRTVQCTITPNGNALHWCCAFDRERPKFLYLGSHRGTVYVYDIRQPDQQLEEFPVGHVQQDFTAVVKICPVDPTSTIPCGGFLVCKLKSIWFYEYMPTQQVECHLLNVAGVFSAMSYDAGSGLVLITVRPTCDKPTTLLLATLEKMDGMFTLQIRHTFEGSRVQTVMYRSAQVYLNDADTLVASYLEDTKMMSTWCTNGGRRSVQQLPMGDTILDICPIRATPGQTYLAALSECRCRIYRLNTE